MGKHSQYLERKLLDHVYGKTAYTAPATLYIALLKSEPVEGVGGVLTLVEANYTGYARKSVANTTANWNDAVGRLKTNKTDIIFATCTGGENDITHWAILDAAAPPEEVLDWGAITYNGTPVTKRVNAGDIPRILAGELEIKYVNAP